MSAKSRRQEESEVEGERKGMKGGINWKRTALRQTLKGESDKLTATPGFRGSHRSKM